MHTAEFCGQSMETSSQICRHCTVHQLSEHTTEIIDNKHLIFFSNFGKALCKSGRAQETSGTVQDSKGRAQRPQKYAQLEHCRLYRFLITG